MAYQSPLGYNFKLEASIAAAKESQGRETPKNDEPRRENKSFQLGRRESGFKRNNSPNWQRENWRSPNPRHSMRDEPVHISQYYHPSMVEDPWKELENVEPP